MGQQTSELWKELVNKRDTRREYQFDIDGTIYGEDDEVEHSVDYALYDQFGIGNASVAALNLKLFADEIPRGATIKRYVRLVNGDQKTEWIPQGVFFTNKRSDNDGLWTIEAYDVMRKADTDWDVDPALVFPMKMKDVVDLLAGFMEAEIDERTVINPDYTIPQPDGAISIREVLQYIAAAHGGNWIVTPVGKLRLVPLISMPPETNYLVTEDGDRITLGGDRILVG